MQNRKSLAKDAQSAELNKAAQLVMDRMGTPSTLLSFISQCLSLEKSSSPFFLSELCDNLVLPWISTESGPAFARISAGISRLYDTFGTAGFTMETARLMTSLSEEFGCIVMTKEYHRMFLPGMILLIELSNHFVACDEVENEMELVASASHE